jgi:hypothetical protein
MFLTVESYPDEEAVRLVAAAARVTRKDAAAILEDFGEFITPDLMSMYGGMAHPDWRTLEFLENTETTIHRVVRARDGKASPPEIRCTRTSPREVMIIYGSARRLCALARGLVRGVAQHYGEKVRISEPDCMSRGAARCKLVVRLE